MKQPVKADLRFDLGSLTPEPTLVLGVERRLLALQVLHLHSKEEEGKKDKGKGHIPTKSHISLRFIYYAKLIPQLTWPLFLTFSLLQISTCLAPSLHSDRHLGVTCSEKRPSLAINQAHCPFIPRLCAIQHSSHYPLVPMEHLHYS